MHHWLMVLMLIYFLSWWYFLVVMVWWWWWSSCGGDGCFPIVVGLLYLSVFLVGVVVVLVVVAGL